MLEITTLLFFFFNDTATTEIYTLSLHDALPILEGKMDALKIPEALDEIWTLVRRSNKYIDETMPWALAKEEDKRRSEEHTSELQSRQYLVCRLLLEKKKKKHHYKLYITRSA